MRKSIVFICFTAIHILLIMVMVLHTRRSQNTDLSERQDRTALVRSLRLTDLCLFTEARYTRHPAMADRFAPFQDHPTALEHFPSGSLVTPPAMRLHEHSP
jgi:hypothetical protein